LPHFTSSGKKLKCYKQTRGLTHFALHRRLKDSDVTWLYGPLHTAIDWSPPPKPPSDPTSVDKDHDTHDRLGLSSTSTKKPILKHRTISELLVSALPPSFEDPHYYHDEDEKKDLSNHDDEERPTRPPLAHTKSDSTVTQWAQRRRNIPVLRKDSPPRIIAQHGSPDIEVPPTAMPLAGPDSRKIIARSASSESATGSSQDQGSQERPVKRHITFNTFVEQCIAIDSPKKPAGILKRPSPDSRWTAAAHEDDDDGSVLLFLRCDLRLKC
jgi:hypothetical protein